jgi:RimJ/RimL family protein N-acetyltransferase
MTYTEPTAELRLRPLQDDDIDQLFEQMRDPAAAEMAAFTAEDPDDREAFDAWVERNRNNPTVNNRVITADGALVGSIASFTIDGDREVTYWIGREHWGKGYASRALALLIESVETRPLHARVAADNSGSIRVLEKNGFRRTGTERGYANARGREIEEFVYRLD